MIPDLTLAEIARFRSKLRLEGCGLRWAGPVNNHGYGRFEIYRNGKRKRILAHRLMFKLSFGRDPGRAVVRHGCDIPACLTPDCLTDGTQADNIQDAVERGRMDISALAAYRAARDVRASERITATEKRCSHCRQVKPVEDFYRHRGNVDGRAYNCKACALDSQRRYRGGLSERERAA